MDSLNNLFNTSIVSSALGVGLVVLAAQTLEPVPDVVKNSIHGNLLLKFVILFLLGLVMHRATLQSKDIMIYMLTALLLIVLFEYWRHVDKERAEIQAAKQAPENMWARDPYSRVDATYPGEAPIPSIDMGVPREHMWARDPYGRTPSSYSGQAPGHDIDLGLPKLDALGLTPLLG